MSYINDALRKIQREKGSDYASCSDTIFDGPKRSDTRPKKLPLIAGALTIIFIAAAGIAVWWWQNVKTGSGPQFAAVVQVPPVAAVPSSPPAVDEPGTVREALPVQDQTPADAAAVSSPQVQAAPGVGESLSAEAGKDKGSPESAADVNKKELLNPAPASPRVLYERALKKHREGRLKEAETLYQEVVKTDPRHVSALNNLGVIWMNRKMYKQAVESFSKALKVRYDYADAHYNLACLYARKNDKKQSLFYLKNAIDLNPEVRQWALQDHDFKMLADLPEFNQLVGPEGN